MTARGTRIVIVEDHEVFGVGLEKCLADFELVGHAAAVDEAIAVIREVTPDLVFLDVNLGDGGNGADVIKGTREVQPAPKFLALTSLESFESVSRLFIAGVDGYITKGTQCDQIIESALQVLAGERPVSRGIADHMLSIDEAAARRRKVDALTDEEREIVRLIARGYAYREVRKKLELERQENPGAAAHRRGCRRQPLGDQCPTDGANHRGSDARYDRDRARRGTRLRGDRRRVRTPCRDHSPTPDLLGVSAATNSTLHPAGRLAHTRPGVHAS